MSVMKILADQIGVLVIQNAEQADLIMRLQRELEHHRSTCNRSNNIPGYEENDQEGVSHVFCPPTNVSGA